MDKLTQLSSSVTFTENDINIRLAHSWTAIDRLSIITMSDLSDRIKRKIFQATVVSILILIRHIDADKAYRGKKG